MTGGLAAIIAGAVVAAQYLGIADTALNAAIDINSKAKAVIEMVLPHKAAPFHFVPIKPVVIPPPKAKKTAQAMPKKAP